MKNLLAIITLMFISLSASSQSEITMTKQEFLDNQKQVFNQFDELKAQMESEESNLSSNKTDLASQEELQAAADCLGVTTQKVEAITKSIDSATLIEASNVCASNLPESITISGLDWSNVPGLAEYNNCNEQFIAKKSGVPIEKYKKCAAKQAQN